MTHQLVTHPLECDPMITSIPDRCNSLLQEINGFLKLAAESLESAVTGMEGVGLSPELTYIPLQAKSVASVAMDVHLLIGLRRFQNILALSRIGFESRIQFDAALKIPDFVAQKYLTQFKGNIKELEELIEWGVKIEDVREMLESNKRSLEEMRKAFVGVPERQWTFYEAAKASGLELDHKQFYSLLSKAAHVTPMGLVTKEEPLLLVSIALRLLRDTMETCASLVYFRDSPKAPARPMTTKWLELIEPLKRLQSAYPKLDQRFQELSAEELRDAAVPSGSQRN